MHVEAGGTSASCGFDDQDIRQLGTHSPATTKTFLQMRSKLRVS